MPPILLVCLSKGRVEGTDEIAKGLAVHTPHTAVLGTVEHPGVLLTTPEQCPFQVFLLALRASQWSTEGADKDPLLITILKDALLGTIQIML